jgi:hypothetical protein
MAAFASLRYWMESASTYTPEWREFLKKESPGIEWAYWLKDDPVKDMPFLYRSYFCFSLSHTGYLRHSEELNHWGACPVCKKMTPKLWPLFIFQCDECDDIFIHKYPVKYHLCSDCGGD